jgi:hypothetical protein
MDLGKLGWGDVDWIGLAQDRDRWRALSSVITTGGLSSSAQLHRVSGSEGHYKNLPWNQLVSYRHFKSESSFCHPPAILHERVASFMK